MNIASAYTFDTGGLMREEDYPYTGATDGDGICKFDKSKIIASASNFSVVSSNEDQIAVNLVKNGPLAGNNFLSFQPHTVSLTNLTLSFGFFFFFSCSCYQFSLHAELRWRSVMPLHVLEEPQPRCVVGGLWLSSVKVQGEAVLDH